MRRLVKTAVLHQDEALRNSTGTAMPELPESFKFPVVVDFTEFEHKLEQHFDSINEKIESLRLKLTAMIHCESGENTVTYTSETGKTNTQSIQFRSAFTKRPEFQVAVIEALKSPPSGPWVPIAFQVKTTELNQKGATFYTEVTNNLDSDSYLTFKWMACGN